MSLKIVDHGRHFLLSLVEQNPSLAKILELPVSMRIMPNLNLKIKFLKPEGFKDELLGNNVQEIRSTLI